MSGLMGLMAAAGGLATAAAGSRDRSAAKVGQLKHFLEDGVAQLFQLGEGICHGFDPPLRIALPILTYQYARIINPKKETSHLFTSMSRTQLRPSSRPRLPTGVEFEGQTPTLPSAAANSIGT